MLSPRRASNLCIRRWACLRLLPFPGTGDVLLATSMISHPLAYVARHPRHLAPTMGLGAPSSRDLFWTGTLFLPSERSHPGAPDGICVDPLRGAEATCIASSLADLIGGIRLSDEPAPDAGAGSSEGCLVDLLGKLHIANEPTSDIE